MRSRFYKGCYYAAPLQVHLRRGKNTPRVARYGERRCVFDDHKSWVYVYRQVRVNDLASANTYSIQKYTITY